MKKRQATKKYNKKRQTTKKYKKHTKKQRKTRKIIRRHRKTRKLNKKKQRGGDGDMIKSVMEQKIKDKNEEFDEFKKNNISVDTNNALSQMLAESKTVFTSNDSLIKNYYNHDKTAETELTKIQAAYDEFFIKSHLTNEQFIYLILTTNESDITKFTKDIVGSIQKKYNTKYNTNIDKNKKNKTVKTVNIDDIRKITDITTKINPIIFTLFFYINMVLMKYYLDVSAANIGADLLLLEYPDPLGVEKEVKKMRETEPEEFEGFEDPSVQPGPPEEERFGFE